ncbi:unnamed protein product [Auanema sp. JU1783]|nr:unnamed protein product [Auanema sp. JU1783]
MFSCSIINSMIRYSGLVRRSCVLLRLQSVVKKIERNIRTDLRKSIKNDTNNNNIIDLSTPRSKGPGSSSSSSKDSYRRAKKLVITPGSVALLVLPAFTFCLGVWQCCRLQWKLTLIEELKKQLSATAIEFPIDNLESLLDLEYRRVRIIGEFLHEREFIIAPRGRFDVGYVQKDSGSLLSDNNMSSHGAHVITPFKIKGTNLIIMVNRGWVPPELISRSSRLNSEPKGIVTFEAIVRKSEKRPQFVGENIPEQGVWFYKDFYQMAQQYGTHPVYVEAVHETTVPGGPIAGQTNINVRNEHLSYLTTWFTLTAVTIGMWVARFRR